MYVMNFTLVLVSSFVEYKTNGLYDIIIRAVQL